MKITDLIEELNLNKVDQLLNTKVKGGFWTTFSGSFTWSVYDTWGFTWTDGDDSTRNDN